MSHRVTTETQITNRAFAIAALTKAGASFKEIGGQLHITAGRTQGTLDLATGQIAGDTDRWNDTDFDALRQAYAEESYVSELRRQGASIQSRTVDSEGNIVILYQTTG